LLRPLKLNRTSLIRIDGVAANRSQFIREAVEEKLRRTSGKDQSAWEALSGTDGLDVTIKEASGKVRRIDL